MTIQEAIQFIRHKELSPATPTSWADLGCGSGIFTTALAHYLPPGSTLYAVDHQINTDTHIPAPAGVTVHPVQLDFVTQPFPFTALDGIIMANALHYVKDQSAFLHKLNTVLQPDNTIIIVEYDTDKPVPVWVPHPLSFISLEKLFRQHGYTHIEKIRERTSIYGRANLYTSIIRK